MGGLPFPTKSCSAVDPLRHHCAMLTVVVVKHVAVQLVAVMKLEEFMMDVVGMLQSEDQ